MLTEIKRMDYAFYMEGWDTNAEYGIYMLDNGTSEWFSITERTPLPSLVQKELKRDQVWVA
jgi:hypothetical protein